MNFKKILSTCTILIIAINTVACSFFTNTQNDNPETQIQDGEVKTAVFSSSVNTLCYDTLSSDIKKIYNILLEGINNFEAEIVVNGSEEDIEIAYRNVIADHPELFYLSGYVYKDASDIVNRNRYTVYPSYTETEEEAEDYLNRANIVAQSWIAEIPSNASDYEKAKILFTKVIDNTSYISDTTHNQDMLSVFLFNQSVCGGYCKGYTYLLQQVGIPAACIYGVVDDNAHSWVIDIIDNNYYLSDPTNGDSIFYQNDTQTNYVNFAYLNCSSFCNTNVICS